MRKLRSSEKIILAIYLVFPISRLLANEELGFLLGLLSLVAIITVSIWDMWKSKSISLVLWPFYILLGTLIGALVGAYLSPSADVSFGAGIIFMAFAGAFLLGLALLLLLSALFLAQKDVLKPLALLMLSFGIILSIDLIFVTPNEIGERGCEYVLESIPDWRVFCE